MPSFPSFSTIALESPMHDFTNSTTMNVLSNLDTYFGSLIAYIDALFCTLTAPFTSLSSPSERIPYWRQRISSPKIVTVTRTQIQYVHAPRTMATRASFTEHHRKDIESERTSRTSCVENNTPALRIVGVVPGNLPTSSTPLDCLSQRAMTISANDVTPPGPSTTRSSDTRRTPRTSSYARPSPPGFIYPHAIVPQREQAIHTKLSHREIVPKADSRAIMDTTIDLPEMPMGVVIFMCVCMVLGLIWSVAVWRVNYALGASDAEEQQTVSRHGKKRGIWGRLMVRNEKRKTDKKGKEKSLDKTSKYAPIPTTSSTSSSSASTHSRSGGEPVTSTATGVVTQRRSAYDSDDEDDQTPFIRMRKLPRRSVNAQKIAGNPPQQSSPHSPALAPWYGSNLCTEATPVSPENPYLPVPPQRPRSEGDYVKAHTAFFTPGASSLQPSISKTHARTPSPAHTDSGSSPHFSFEDFDALEAQNPRPDLLRAKSDDGSDGGIRRNWSWINTVDGAVNAAVNGFVRWTEDDGGEEALLLPMRKVEKE